MLEFEQEENPFRDHLAVEPITQVKGMVAVPGGAGLGIEIDRAVIEQYRVSLIRIINGKGPCLREHGLPHYSWSMSASASPRCFLIAGVRHSPIIRVSI
jgi:hypothetical protein